MVGALRWPIRALIPTEVGLPSVNARAGSWQVLHATVPSADRRPSKNNLWPRAIFSGVCALTGGIAARSEEHTSELQSQSNLVCRLLLEKKKNTEPSDIHDIPSGDSRLQHDR